MKKRMLALSLAALCLSLSVCANAATVDQSSPETLGTEFSFTYKNDPTYTITIPSSVEISKEGTQVDIVAENVANLDGQKISVTLASTNYYRNQLVLSGKAANGQSKVIRYQLETADGTVLETTGNDTVSGSELASFTADGTVSYTVKPVIASVTAKGVTYTGSMTYGIQLVDAE